MVDSEKNAGGSSEEQAKVSNLDAQREAEDSLLPVDEHIEEVTENGKKVRRRGVYLLPNLFTTAALFSGFYAIVSAMHNNFESAAIAIFVAMILDGLDGRVARMTNTASEFGVQYDSLSDMVSFGLAPSLVIFSWALSDLGKFGWAVAFIYAAGAALRLARFNTQVDIVDKRYFIGLASPAAAAVIAGMVWAGHDLNMEGRPSLIAGLVTAAMGLLMVSNVKYSSFKEFDFKRRVPFVFILVVVLIFGLVTIDPPRILLGVFACYALSGPAMWLWRLRQKT